MRISLGLTPCLFVIFSVCCIYGIFNNIGFYNILYIGLVVQSREVKNYLMFQIGLTEIVW